MNDKASKTKGLIWFLAACTIAVLMALGLAPLVRAVPWSWEQQLAKTINDDDTVKVCRGNAEKRAALEKLVKRLFPVYPNDARFSIDVRIVNDPAVNAYAELGGQITVNSGLLKHAKSAEELAGVLAHEITHVSHRHILENITSRLLTTGGIQALAGDPSAGVQVAQYFLNMSFTRGQEAEADEGGLKRLQQAHIDTRGFKAFFERMENSAAAPAFLSDHPSNDFRLAMADQFQSTDIKPVLTAEEWQRLKTFCQ